MQLLQQAIGRSKIALVPSTKLFYSQFPYRVMVDLNKATEEEKTNPRTHCSPKNTKGKHMFRKEKNSCSVFFENETDASRYIRGTKRLVKSVSAVDGETEANFLAANPQIRLRKFLFWARYRYMIQFKRIKDADWLGICDFFEEFHSGYDADERAERFNFTFTNPPKLYLRDKSDIALISLAFGNHISNIQEAIIRGDTDDQFVAAQHSH